MHTYRPMNSGIILYRGDTVRCTPYTDDDVRHARIIDVCPNRQWWGRDMQTKETYKLDDGTIEQYLRNARYVG